MDSVRRTALVRVVVALVVMGVIGAIVVAAGGGSSKPPSDAPASLPSSPTALPTFTDDQFHSILAGLKGTVVVVNIWASWCGPCVAEAPGLAQLSTRYEGRVQFVGVDIEDQPAPARAFIQRFGWTYPSVADPQREIQRGYGLLGQPDTIVYDAAGEEKWRRSGPVATDDLQAAIEAALA
jgi:cytochrome c biogenesis protein CcmG/thiol:disulfide interchange protein DsbE